MTVHEQLATLKENLSLIEQSGWNIKKYTVPELLKMVEIFLEYSQIYEGNIYPEDNKWVFVLAEVDFLELTSEHNQRSLYREIKMSMIDKISGDVE